MQITSAPANLLPTHQQFSALVLEFQSFLKRCGIDKPAFSKAGLGYFRALPEAEQVLKFRALREYLSICHDLEREGLETLRNPQQLLRTMAFRLRVSVPDEFVDQLTGDEVVEIYDCQGSQLYRNLAFFEISDYTIDEFFGRTWDTLFERSAAVNKAIFESIERMTKLKQCIPVGVAEHHLRERFTENRKIIKINFKHIAPLLRGGEMVAWIVSCTAQTVLANCKDTEMVHFL